MPAVPFDERFQEVIWTEHPWFDLLKEYYLAHTRWLEDTTCCTENVSLLYRYGLLAKALKLPARDLIALKALSGLDPFKPLISGSVSTLADDHPFSQTLGFVEVAEKVKDSGFRVEDLDTTASTRSESID